MNKNIFLSIGILVTIFIISNISKNSNVNNEILEQKQTSDVVINPIKQSTNTINLNERLLSMKITLYDILTISRLNWFTIWKK